jgi:putative phosphoesterase
MNEHAMSGAGAPPRMVRVGVISDTHGLLRPEAEARLAGADHIIHAGDIGAPDIVPRLLRLAPVTAIRGNVDEDAWAEAYPETAVVTLAGRRIHILHDRAALAFDPAASGFSVVISGHSHRPKVETSGGVLYLNPGSAGRRRFGLPVTLAIIELTAGGAEARIHDLGL